MNGPESGNFLRVYNPLNSFHYSLSNKKSSGTRIEMRPPERQFRLFLFTRSVLLLLLLESIYSTAYRELSPEGVRLQALSSILLLHSAYSTLQSNSPLPSDAGLCSTTSHKPSSPAHSIAISTLASESNLSALFQLKQTYSRKRNQRAETSDGKHLQERCKIRR